MTSKEEYSNTFEKVLDQVGSNGKYQKTIILLILMPFSLIYTINASNGILLMSTPKHWCNVPCREVYGFSEEQWKNLTIPIDETGTSYSSCQQYSLVNPESSCYPKPEFSNKTEDCTHGWIHDQSIWKSTPVTTFGLVCNNKHIVSLVFSVNMAAMAIGTFVFSFLSDRYGRLPMLYLTSLINLGFGLGSCFARTAFSFVILRFGLSFAYYSLYQMVYLIVMELCSSKFRNVGSMLSFMCFYGGVILLSFLAGITAEWRIYLFCSHLCSIVFLIFARLLPESPRWLLSMGRVEECEKILKRIAVFNGVEYKEDLQILLLQAAKEEKQTYSLSDIVKSKILFKRLLMMSYLMSVNCMLLFGIALNVYNMVGNQLVNFAVMGIAQMPAQVLGTLSTTYLGRKFSLIVYFSCSSVFTLVLIPIINDEIKLVIGMCWLILFVGCLDLIIYVPIGELFPTPFRSVAYGTTAIIGLASSTVVPPFIAMGQQNPAIPYIILSAIAASGAIVSVFVPETFGLALPQTIEEAEAISKKYPFWMCVTRFPKRDKSNNSEKLTSK